MKCSTPYRLFLYRVARNAVFQYKVWRTVIDGIVALYIVLPAVAFIVYNYIQWWSELPSWSQDVPEGVFYSVLGLPLLWAHVRLFVEEADGWFLTQRREWMRSLKRYGFLYSFLFQALAVTVVMAFVLPFYRFRLDMSLLEIAAVYMAACLVSFLAGSIRELFQHCLSGWLKNVAVVVSLGFAYQLLTLSVLFPPNLMAIIGLFPLLILYVLIKGRLSRQGTFDKEVEKERELRLRWVSVFLAQAVDIKKLNRRKRPWIFRDSKPLFRNRSAANRLAEGCIKAFARSSSNLLLLAQFMGIGMLALFLLPPAMKWMGWAGLELLLYAHLIRFWNGYRNEPYLLRFSWRPSDLLQGAEKTVFVLLLCGSAPIGLIAGALSLSWLGALLSAPVCYLAAKVLSGFVMLFKVDRKS